jgi:hypothetical protein
MGGNMRLVQGGGMDDRGHARHAEPNEIRIAYRSNPVGKWRGFDVDPARRSAILAKAPHQSLAQMSAAAGD